MTSRKFPGHVVFARKLERAPKFSNVWGACRCEEVFPGHSFILAIAPRHRYLSPVSYFQRSASCARFLEAPQLDGYVQGGGSIAVGR